MVLFQSQSRALEFINLNFGRARKEVFVGLCHVMSRSPNPKSNTNPQTTNTSQANTGKPGVNTQKRYC